MKSWILAISLLAAAFCVTRPPAFFVQYHDCDINLYARYAAESLAAERTGEPFYDLHRRRMDMEIKASPSDRALGLEEYKTVEYPPLAVALMTLPARLMDSPFEGDFPTGLQPRYAWAYVTMMVVFDAAVLVLAALLVTRLFPTQSPWQWLVRCLVYVVCSWPLYGVLYTRLDLPVALLLIIGLALLVSRVHWALALLALATAIHLKLVPVVLAPLWVFATLPAAILQRPFRAAVGFVAMRTAVLVGFVGALGAFFYLRQGPAVTEFLDYHKDRGLEIESTWASLLLPAKYLGSPWEVYHSHGSFNVNAPAAPFLAALATAALAAVAILAPAVFLVGIRRRQVFAALDASTIAQAWPRLTVGMTLCALLGSIAANKVFSPQYVLWVLPLLPLVDCAPGRRRLIYLSALAMCLLTMRIFPDAFYTDIVGLTSTTGGLPTMAGPTFQGAVLLLTRNALLVGLTATVAHSFLCGISAAESPGRERIASPPTESIKAKQTAFLPLR